MRILIDHYLEIIVVAFHTQVCVIYLDLDEFGSVVQQKGWPQYSPNPITKELTRMIDTYARQTFAQVLWGLDHDRGTEECILVIQNDPDQVIGEMRKIKDGIKNVAEKHDAKTSLSVGIACGSSQSTYKPLNSTKKTELRRYPLVYTSFKALKEAKRSGGDTITRY